MTDTEIIHLDYTLKTVEERTSLVEKIVQNASPSQLTHKYLEILADYMLDARTKTEKRDRTILTNNRMVTINKREVSYEELVSKFENGEDGVSNLIVEGNKGVILSPKIEITAADLKEVPGLKELQCQIKKLEATAAYSSGKKKYYLKKAIIQMRQDQYALKQIFKPPISASSSYVSHDNTIHLNEDIHLDENQEPIDNGLISFFNPSHIQALLCHYDILKESMRQSVNNDFHYLMADFDELKEEALAPYPHYADLAQCKIDGKTNLQCQELLFNKHNIKYSVEYISALWRKKIPKIIAEKAKEDYLVWYFTFVERGQWKRCSRCGEVKLAHNRFFSKNNASKDGFYSICKACRNKRRRKE